MGYDDGQCKDKYKWAELMGWHIDRPGILLMSNQSKNTCGRHMWRERVCVCVAVVIAISDASLTNIAQ